MWQVRCLWRYAQGSGQSTGRTAVSCAALLLLLLLLLTELEGIHREVLLRALHLLEQQGKVK